MTIILHITTRSQWHHAEKLGEYRADSLASEGFMHCSVPTQIPGVVHRFFQGQTDLLLLCIDSTLVQAELRYDAIATGEKFPHIYGALNLDAVVQVVEFHPDPTREVTLPQAVTELCRNALNDSV
ncbi:DUF952 domain-containing protein [Pantanalinema sp. GBBB05]|uniref:DUF952 domain-containing protein n=1 Tax=Pantanalinema sp. GBBB05 TaxID=2604139 RepID=UPI001DCADC61|nr:DUF952 domain-containing protein [Pantanalinema sp. GBBB05]